MKTCCIIISHFNAPIFLRACIRSIGKYRNEKILHNIIVADQSNDDIHNQITEEYKEHSDVEIVRMEPLYSGYGLDWLFRNRPMASDYICQLHVDVVAINKNFLSMPIALIEQHKFAFVGQLQFICDGTQSIYPPNPFFAMAQCYNVAPTNIYRELAMIPGFCRFHNRPKAEGMSWASSDWSRWASEDYEHRGSDDDVVAFHWQDCHRQHDKLGLAITGYIEPSYGRIIEDMVLHFGSHRESLSVLDYMPKDYVTYLNRINENYSDELIEEMISKAKANKPPELEILSRNLWNGQTKESYPTNSILNARIEELKK